MDTLDRESIDFALKEISSNHPLRGISFLQTIVPTVAVRNLFGEANVVSKVKEHKITKKLFIDKRKRVLRRKRIRDARNMNK